MENFCKAFIIMALYLSRDIYCDKNYYHFKLYGNQLLMYYVNFYVGSPPKIQAFLPDTGSSELFLFGQGCRGCTKANIYPKYNPKKSDTSHPVSCKENSFYCVNSCSSSFTQCRNSIRYQDSTQFQAAIFKDDLKFNLQEDSQILVTNINVIDNYIKSSNQEIYNGIMGLGDQGGSILSKWFSQKSDNLHKFSVCLGEKDGFFEIGDIKSTEGIQKTIIPIQTQYFYGVNNLASLKFGQKELKPSHYIFSSKLIIDTGSSLSHLKAQLLINLIKQLNKICKDTKKCYKIQYLISQGKNYLTCFNIKLQFNEKLQDMFPSLQFILETGQIIIMKPSQYFKQYRNQRQKRQDYCMMINKNQNKNILGVNWLINKRLIFNIKQKQIQIQYNQNCQYIKIINQNQQQNYQNIIYIILFVCAFIILLCCLFRDNIKKRLTYFKKSVKLRNQLKEQIQISQQNKSTNFNGIQKAQKIRKNNKTNKRINKKDEIKNMSSQKFNQIDKSLQVKVIKIEET